MLNLTLLLSLLPFTSPALLRVPSDYPDIASAVAAAATQGDVIAIAPGIWSGSANCGINIVNKAVTIRADDTAVGESVQIDCHGTGGRILSISDVQEAGGRIQISGISFTGGLAPGLWQETEVEGEGGNSNTLPRLRVRRKSREVEKASSRTLKTIPTSALQVRPSPYVVGVLVLTADGQLELLPSVGGNYGFLGEKLSSCKTLNKTTSTPPPPTSLARSQSIHPRATRELKEIDFIGGCILISNCAVPIILSNVQVSGCSAVKGGGVAVINVPSFTISDSRISDSGLILQGINNSFVNLSRHFRGAALYVILTASLAVTRSEFTDNVFNLEGITSSLYDIRGGGIFCDQRGINSEVGRGETKPLLVLIEASTFLRNVLICVGSLGGVRGAGVNLIGSTGSHVIVSNIHVEENSIQKTDDVVLQVQLGGRL